MPQKGNIALVILIVIGIAAIGVYFFVNSLDIPPPVVTQRSSTSSAEIKVTKTDYQNPFDTETPTAGTSAQYSNPFESYENPFTNLQ